MESSHIFVLERGRMWLMELREEHHCCVPTLDCRSVRDVSPDFGSTPLTPQNFYSAWGWARVKSSCSLSLAHNQKPLWPAVVVFLSTVRSHPQNNPQTCQHNRTMNCSAPRGIQQGRGLSLHRRSCAWARRNIPALRTGELRSCQNTPETVWPFFPLCKTRWTDSL